MKNKYELGETVFVKRGFNEIDRGEISSVSFNFTGPLYTISKGDRTHMMLQVGEGLVFGTLKEAWENSLNSREEDLKKELQNLGWGRLDMDRLIKTLTETCEKEGYDGILKSCGGIVAVSEKITKILSNIITIKRILASFPEAKF